MVSIYLFKVVPISPAWTDPLDSSISWPARQEGEQEVAVIAASEEEARAQLPEEVEASEFASIELLNVSPWLPIKTVAEVATEYGVHRTTLNKAIDRKIIPARKSGTIWLIDTDSEAFKTWLAAYPSQSRTKGRKHDS